MRSPTADDPLVIGYVSHTSLRPGPLHENLGHIEGLPFDGFVVNVPQTYALMSPGYRVDRADLRRWLEDMPRVTARNPETFLKINVDAPGGLLDDDAWALATRNWRVLAEEAQEAGFRGIFFDNEEYAGRFQDWPEDLPDGAPDLPLAEWREAASARGWEIGAVVAEAFPGAVLMAAHGPYLSVPRTPEEFPAAEGQAGGPGGHELRGPFLTGMMEGLGPDVAFVDAGELYALRGADEFAESRRFREEEVPERIDWPVDPALLASWSDRVTAGHMVYTDEFPPGSVQTPRSFERTLLNALDQSEGWVVVYTDWPQFDWFDPDRLPPEWEAAAARAISQARHTERGGGGADLLRGAAEADRLIGRGGDDALRGRGGDDLVIGGRGADAVRGGRGQDALLGGADDDALHGGRGADRLSGGRGDDVLRGGAGADVFVLARGGGTDVVTDFDPARDAVDARGRGWTVADRGADLVVELHGAELVLRGLAGAEFDIF